MNIGLRQALQEIDVHLVEMLNAHEKGFDVAPHYMDYLRKQVSPQQRQIFDQFRERPLTTDDLDWGGSLSALGNILRGLEQRGLLVVVGQQNVPNTGGRRILYQRRDYANEDDVELYRYDSGRGDAPGA